MLPKEIQHLRPIYVTIARKKGQNSWAGRVEKSFCMGWSLERVRLFWSGKAYSFLGEHTLCGKYDAENNIPENKNSKWEYHVFDVEDEECPIDIDFDQWVLDISTVSDKFNMRNAKFSMKE